MRVLDIYTKLADAGFARSQVEFSEVWLGRSKRYYSHLVAEGREPGLATLIALEGRLRRQAGTQPESSSRNRLLEMSDELRSVIATRSVVDVRRHRPENPSSR